MLKRILTKSLSQKVEFFDICYLPPFCISNIFIRCIQPDTILEEVGLLDNY